jgi:uncharacterized protein (DUF2345 family)
MKNCTLMFATTILVSQFSLALAADPGTRQLQRPPMQQQRVTVQPLKITPEYLNKKILALTQQVQTLQKQVTSLRSVVQVNQNGATIHAEHLSINAQKNLTMTSGKDTSLTAGDHLNLTSPKILSLQGQEIVAEGSGKVKLKAPQIKFNDGNKPIALQDSPVAGGKIISGSTSVFAQ